MINDNVIQPLGYALVGATGGVVNPGGGIGVGQSTNRFAGIYGTSLDVTSNVIAKSMTLAGPNGLATTSPYILQKDYVVVTESSYVIDLPAGQPIVGNISIYVKYINGGLVCSGSAFCLFSSSWAAAVNLNVLGYTPATDFSLQFTVSAPTNYQLTVSGLAPTPNIPGGTYSVSYQMNYNL